jgi:hypothetical protein
VVKTSGAATGKTPSLVGLASDEILTRTIPLVTHAGGGNSTLSTTVAIDAPASLRHGRGRQWYRVRATGTTTLPGPGRVSSD